MPNEAQSPRNSARLARIAGPPPLPLRSDRYPVETQLHGAAEEGGET